MPVPTMALMAGTGAARPVPFPRLIACMEICLMRLRCSPLAHRPLSVMVALALCMSVPAAAHASPVEDCDGATEDPACTSSAADSPGGRTGWLIGGLAVLAGGAAAAGGGGSGGSGA